LVIWAKEGHLPLTEREAVIRGHVNKQRILVTSRIFKALNSLRKFVPKGEKASYQSTMNVEELLPQLYKYLAEDAETAGLVIEVGILDDWKQIGFYADVDDALNLVASAFEFSEESFEAVASFADEALRMAKSEPYEHEILANIYECYKADFAMKFTAKKRSTLSKEIAGRVMIRSRPTSKDDK
jgi:hypothetical protein